MRLALVFCVTALPVVAQTDFGALTDAERLAFGTELRALLRAEPELVAAAVTPPNYAAEAYQEKAQADLDLIASLTRQVLAGTQIALFTGEDCADCANALEELNSNIRYIRRDVQASRYVRSGKRCLGRTARDDRCSVLRHARPYPARPYA